jgi:LysM repeat protein
MPDGHWSANKPVGSKEGYEVHTVKSGDTLWDITKEYIRNPFLWPQIWELNPNIVNPHWIYPGDRLLLKKMVVAAPQVEAPTTPAAQPESMPPPPPRSAAAEPVAAPAEAPPAGPPPPSPVASYSQMYCAGFFSGDEIRPRMVIAGTEEAETATLLADRDIVYVNQGALAGVKPGEEYLVVRRLVDFSRYGPEMGQASSTSKYGFGYKDLGRLRILLAQENVSTAQVVFACEHLRVGDILIPDEQRVSPVGGPPAPFDKFAPPNDKTRGSIFFAKEFKSVIGAGDIVYIDVGQQQNVQVGDYFRILRFFTPANISKFNQRDFGQYRQTYEAVRKVIGELVVLHVEGKTATALVTQSTQDIALRDGIELE